MFMMSGQIALDELCAGLVEAMVGNQEIVKACTSPGADLNRLRVENQNRILKRCRKLVASMRQASL